MKPTKPKNDNNFIVIYSTNSFEEAHIIRGKLESEGIPSMVQRESVAGALGLTVGRIGQVNVLILEKDYNEAYAILFDDAPADPQLYSGDDYIYLESEEDDE